MLLAVKPYSAVTQIVVKRPEHTCHYSDKYKSAERRFKSRNLEIKQLYSGKCTEAYQLPEASGKDAHSTEACYEENYVDYHFQLVLKIETAFRFREDKSVCNYKRHIDAYKLDRKRKDLL